MKHLCRISDLTTRQANSAEVGCVSNDPGDDDVLGGGDGKAVLLAEPSQRLQVTARAGPCRQAQDRLAARRSRQVIDAVSCRRPGFLVADTDMGGGKNGACRSKAPEPVVILFVAIR